MFPLAAHSHSNLHHGPMTDVVHHKVIAFDNKPRFFILQGALLHFYLNVETLRKKKEKALEGFMLSSRTL